MFKRKLTTADQLMLLVNLIPIAGVLFDGWDPMQGFLAYCLETVIIGFFTLIKLGIATIFRKNDEWSYEGGQTMKSGLFFIFFFVLHYGMFVGIQITLFLQAANIGNDSSANIFHLFAHPELYLTKQGWLMVLAFALSYAFQELSIYISDREYTNKPMMQIMFEPYIRIFIQQFTVILGGMALGFGAGVLFVVIFAAAKTFFTVFVDYEGALKKMNTSRQK